MFYLKINLDLSCSPSWVKNIEWDINNTISIYQKSAKVGTIHLIYTLMFNLKAYMGIWISLVGLEINIRNIFFLNSYFFLFWNEKSKKLSPYHKCPKYAYLFEHRLMIACIWINNGVEIWSDMCIVLNLMEILKVNLAQCRSMFNVQYRIKSVSFTPLFWQVG